jgi:hypothetical protein
MVWVSEKIVIRPDPPSTILRTAHGVCLLL